MVINIKTKSTSSKMLINLVSSLVVFVLNLIIQFFFSPYIVRELGAEANGFITLANNFITYASLLTSALNSMSGRFISMAYHQNNSEMSNRYYTASFVSGFVAVGILLVPVFFIVMYLEKILNIPLELVGDVKLLFSLVFINFFLITAFTPWAAATYVTNTLYLKSLRTMESQIIKVIVITSLFVFLKPSIVYVGFASLLATIFVTASSFYYKLKLLPEISVKRAYFHVKDSLKLLAAGMWNTINQTGNMLSGGLDILISNLFLGYEEMGLLSIAKGISGVISNLSTTLIGIFAPQTTMKYAAGKTKEIVPILKKGCRICSLLTALPVGGFLALGKEFFALWMPGENSQVLYILTSLSCIHFAFTAGAQCLINVFTATNRLKLSSLSVLTSGLLGTISALIFIEVNPSHGIYAVAGISGAFILLRTVFFIIPFSAKYLNEPVRTFFPEIFVSLYCTGAVFFCGIIFKTLFTPQSWISLIFASSSTAVFGTALSLPIALNKRDIKLIFSFFKKGYIKH